MVENTILERIYHSTLKFLESLTAEETYTTVVQEAVKLIEAEYGSILLDQKGELVRVYASSPVAYQTKNRKKANTYRAFTERRIIVADILDLQKAHPELKKMGVASTIFIPLSYRNKSFGVLIVNSQKKITRSAIELKTLKLFGLMASLAIRKAQLHEETKINLENRDLFLSLAAHELRTPVTTIFGYAQLLYDKLQNKNNTEARWVNALHSESYRLTLLVQDLLEINRIRTGKMQYFFKECALREIIKRAIDNFKFNYPDREIFFDDRLGTNKGVVIGDFNKLLQVLTNLLDNAAKFSGAESKVVIILKASNQSFILQVQDQGMGIAKKDLSRVFEGFYQGSSSSAKEGMGLGLYLAKNIVEEHRGTIHLHSRLNRGTLVEIQLPKTKV